MVIVVIVMTLTALLAPSAVRTFAIFRAQSASLEVLRMARIARREAMEGGRAIVVRVVDDRLEVRRGTTNLCRTSDWAGQFAASCSEGIDLGVVGTSCLAFVDGADYAVGFHTVSFTPLDGQDVCYQPNGEALLAPSGSAVFSRPPPGGLSAVRYEVRRLEGGASIDPVRTIIFPLDAGPRSMR